MNKQVLPAAVAAVLVCVTTAAQAQTQTDAPQARVNELGAVKVTARDDGYAADARYDTHKVDLGPLGTRSILRTPVSVSVLPESLLVNQQAKTVNDALRNLPSVEIRDQQGLEVSRPQSRGFQGSVVQNTRVDGLSIVGTTAIAAENLGSIQVLNGLGGALYGPETPAGVFNYVLKRPTDAPLLRLVESYDSKSIFTEQVDAGGRLGKDHWFGYRLNLVHGEGEGYVGDSNTNRTLYSGAFDFHLNDSTVVQTNFSHYETNVTGLPGSIVYDHGGSTVLPRATDPTRKGLGQTGAGTDLLSSMEMVRILHDFGNDWHLEIGALHEDAIRRLYGITNTFTDDSGDYTTTKNFNAVPRFTIGSNMARLSGHVQLAGMRNDLSIGTNGFVNGLYAYRHSIAVPLGSASLDRPLIYPRQPMPDGGGRYKSGSLTEQTLVAGDTLHIDRQWALQGIFNTSYIHSRSYDADGRITRSDSHNGIFSPTLSVIYTPSSRLTTYATFARSVEEGETAPSGTVNANQFLSPYHDRQYEAGVKFAASDHLLLTLSAFRMTRPLAETDADSNVFAVVGRQRNDGAEFFAQGDVNPDLSVLGGITYVNARLRDTGIEATNDKWVVGVPRVKSDISLDYHPAFAQGMALTGTVHVESRRAATNTNNSFAPGYATYDVGARYAMRLARHALTLRLQVTNVTDKHYYASVADGNIVGSPGANTAYYGTPRTWLASVELDL